MSETKTDPVTGTDEQKKWYRQEWFYVLLSLLLFVGLSYAYFYPAAFEDRVLYQVDGAASQGTGRDVVDYHKATGEWSRWTGSLFGGMPTYQIRPDYDSQAPLVTLRSLLRLEWPIDLMPGDTYLLLMMLLGGYLFMRSWGLKRGLSVFGAILWTFSSYFLILIQAGHIWKLTTLAFIPPTIAGLVYAFHRRYYRLGFIVMAVFTGLQILCNHYQMSYYFAFLMAGMIIAWAVEAGRAGEWKHFGKALLAVMLGGFIGLGLNGSGLYHTWELQQETMRGGSAIATEGGEASSKGLSRDYITAWSYGVDETLTLLIPDAKGGASGAIGYDEPALSKASMENRAFVAQQNRYWGDQPFTAGPVYVGAFVLWLALFGMVAGKGPMKWALLVVSILCLFLSWGHNFPGLTNFFIDHVPLYNKFRTPSSILVVPELTIPLFAVWGLALILRQPGRLKSDKGATITASVLTVGLALLAYLFPSIGGSFMSQMEDQALAPYLAQMPQLIDAVEDLKGVRTAIFRADALRSLIYLLVGLGILLLLFKKKVKPMPTLALVTLLCLVDLWTVDKRYLNDSMYHPRTDITAKVQERTPVDEQILSDPSEARVMNLSVDTFNDATTSYYHRSIGGYNAAKLGRYQDLITGYLSKLDRNVLRALNTKYYIVPDSVTGQRLVVDPEAYGDGWFVSDIHTVSGAQEEYDALGQLPLDRVAVVDKTLAEGLPTGTLCDSLSTVTLTDYAPDRLVYKTSNAHAGLAVLSEIYYPHGWEARIDGEEAEILRVDYLLRGLVVPAGEHEVVLTFDPKTLHVTETTAYAAYGVLLLVILVSGLLYHHKRRRSEKREA